MATFTNTVAEENDTASHAYGWMFPISTFLGTAGWKQQADTGQVVWPVSIVSISSVTWDGTHATYTYTLLQGAALRIGNSIKITNCTTAAMNGTFIIQSLPLATTFTTNNATAAGGPEAETAFGGVDVLVAITNAIGNGSTNTYTYTNTDGVLKAGQSVVITGCTTLGFNGTFTVGSLGAGTFITTTGITHATEAETATGIVTSNSVNSTKGAATIPPTNTNSLYEIWGMGDALQSTFPVIIKLAYTTGSNSTSAPGLNISAGTATDGAGNILGVTTGVQNILAAAAATTNASATPSYMSGSTNRLILAMWPTGTNAHAGIMAIERSHDSTGADTSTYATLIAINGGTALTQQSFTSTAVTVTATKLAAIQVGGITTGSFGASTLVCPIFPLIGAVGNPMTGLLVGKSADWTDQTQFSFTMYNTARNYLVDNASFIGAGLMLYDSTVTVSIIYRYD